MVDRLANVLQDLAQSGELQNAVDLLRRSANGVDSSSSANSPRGIEQQEPVHASSSSHANPCPRGRDFRDVAELIDHYKKRQVENRVNSGSKSCSHGLVKKAPPSKCYSLNFGQYKRVGKFSYQMMSPGRVQISGFCDTDNYTDVVTKGANGLNINANPKSLKLLVSGGLVSNCLLQDGKEWTLGQYTIEIGGVQIRSKKIFGIYNPPYIPENFTSDSKGKTNQCSVTPARKKAKLVTFKGYSDGDENADVNDDVVVIDEPVSPKIHEELVHEEPFCGDPEPKLITGSIIAEYSPLSGKEVVPEIKVIGQEGVYRVIHCEHHATHHQIVAKMEDDLWNLQPEHFNFYLVKLQSGGTTYLEAVMEKGLNVDSITFNLHEKQLVHSETSIVMEKPSMWPPIPLLVVSPAHGQVHYQWEKKSCSMENWEDVTVPPNTCLLYVDTAQQYKCTVGGKSVTFNLQVRCTTQSNRELLINSKDITFGRLIGRGSFGSVYEGKWKGKDVALKRIEIPVGTNREQVAANSHELKVLRMVEHPNIVSMLGWSVTSTDLIIIMKLIRGRSLHLLLFSRNPIKIAVEQKVEVGKGIAAGIQYMHHHNPVIIHRDLKPLNIMVTEDLQNVYICDMGIAKLRYSVHDPTTSTHVVGTYPYMAPEMFEGSKSGTAVDIYSFGCVLIELFGERRVWPGLHTSAEIMRKVCGSFNSPPTMPETNDLPLLYATICQACCQLKPQDRISIDIVVQKLDDITFV